MKFRTIEKNTSSNPVQDENFLFKCSYKILDMQPIIMIMIIIIIIIIINI